jgi:hypothetical protein
MASRADLVLADAVTSGATRSPPVGDTKSKKTVKTYVLPKFKVSTRLSAPITCRDRVTGSIRRLFLPVGRLSDVTIKGLSSTWQAQAINLSKTDAEGVYSFAFTLPNISPALG